MGKRKLHKALRKAAAELPEATRVVTLNKLTKQKGTQQVNHYRALKTAFANGGIKQCQEYYATIIHSAKQQGLERNDS